MSALFNFNWEPKAGELVEALKPLKFKQVRYYFNAARGALIS